MSLARERLSTEALRARAPFLKWEALRAGDVLLTRGRGARSQLIASTTSGRFSHASVWVLILDSLIPSLMEADGLGVGFTPLSGVCFRFPGVSSVPTFSIPHSPLDWKLLRHPQMAGVDVARLREAAERLCQRALHRRYSALSRLVKPAALPRSIEGVAEGLLAFADRMRDTDKHHGIFCSELVAMYYEEVGVTLFKAPIPASSVAPNDLDSESCFLEAVPDAFVDLEVLGQDVEASESEFERPQREEWLPPFVKHRAQGDHVTALADELTAHVLQMHAAVTSESQAIGQRIYEQIVESATEAARLGHTAYADRLSSYAAAVFLLNHLERRIAARETRMSADGIPLPQRTAWAQASMHLTRVHLTLRGQVQDKFLRTTVRHALQTARARRRDPTTSWRARFWINRRRRHIVRRWQETCAVRRMTAGFVDEILQLAPLSPEATEHLNEVVREARLAAMVDAGLAPDALMHAVEGET